MHRQEHRRIFTQFEETSMVSFILDSFISQQSIFTDSNFREVATSVSLHKYHQSEDEPPLPMLSGMYQFVQVAA
jgi:hypothetical protein